MRTLLRNQFAVPVLLTLVIVTLLTAPATAQIDGLHAGRIAPRGVPASVTSFGFGGHPGFHGVPASVTSLGFGGRASFHGVPASVTSTGFGSSNGFRGFRGGLNGSGSGVRNGFDQRPFERGHHHHIRRPFVYYSPYYSFYSAYPYPYYISGDDYPQDNSDSPADDAPAASDYRNYDYRGDDNRQILEEDYRAGLNRQSEQTPQRSPEPVTAQPSTVLVFKDGHQQEVSNYAIIGAILYELNDGRSTKVQLTDLNLTATVKENDQRGVEFQLPALTN